MTTFIPVPIHLPVQPHGSLPFGLFLILAVLLVVVLAINIYESFK